MLQKYHAPPDQVKNYAGKYIGNSY